MEIIGKIIKTDDLKTGRSNGKEWKRQGFVITLTNDKYENEVYVSGWGSKFNFDLLKVGYTVSLKYSIQSNEFQNKWYTNINAHEINLYSDHEHSFSETNMDLAF
jgi:hypothetical protein